MNGFGDHFWQAYLVNFLFWVGLAQGSVMLVVALDVTNARWGRRYVDMARSFAGFLPVSVILFAILLLGRDYIFPWIEKPIPETAAYLNTRFLALRGLIGLAVLAGLSWVVIARTQVLHPVAKRRGASPWSIALAMAFMVIYGYLAFDLIMSLAPHWYSTLLGAHYAMSCFYLGIAACVLVGCLTTGVSRNDRGKLAKLMFGVSPFWVSLLWSQYIVIWYGDIPEETEFIYLRFYQNPWAPVTLVALALAFILPFLILIPRRAKKLGALQFLASLGTVVGLFLEKYLLVVPSLNPHAVTGVWIHLLVTAGFAVLFVVCYRFSPGRMTSIEHLPMADV